MRARRFILPVAILAVLFCPLVNQAAILTYITTGHVTQITDPLGLLDFVDYGDTVTYRSTFDTAVPGIQPFPGYSGYTGIASSVQVGAVAFDTQSPTMAIAHPMDLVDMESGLNVDRPGFLPNGSVMVVLSDQARSQALTDTALPTVPYDLSLFASRSQHIVFWAPRTTPGGYNIDMHVYATVDSFEIVPEPDALAILTIGGLLLITRRSR